jgi:cytochrome c biogenesis protein CcmG, thiol:disulfide interchange protein DsbE
LPASTPTTGRARSDAIETDTHSARGPEAGSSRLAGWGLGLFVVGLGLALMLVGEPAPPRLARGDAAPEFDVAVLAAAGAEDARLASASLAGHVVLVNFWATWCKPCEDEMPAMERLYRQLAPEGFELVAISVDEDREAVERFRERLGISFPIGLDPRQEASRRYQTLGFPESFLIDREGRLVERYVGPREWDHRDYVERIRRLLSQG